MTDNSLAETRERLGSLKMTDFNPVALTMSPTEGVRYKKNRLSGQAYLDVCNVFKFRRDGLSADKDNEDIEQTWHQLARAIAQFRHTPELEAVLDPGTKYVERILRVKTQAGSISPIDFGTQFDFLAGYVEENDGVGLQQVRFDMRKMALEALAIDSNSGIRVARGDDWQVGVGFHLTHGNSWYSPAFMRMICTNGMMAVQRAQKQWLVGLKALSKRALRLRSANQLNSIVVEKTQSLMKTNASLGEMDQVRTVVDREVFDRVFRVSRIEKAYQRAGVREMEDKSIFGMPPKWLDAADSGVSAYDLFNYCTDVSSHGGAVEDSDRRRLNVIANQFFFDGPRLASLPPNPFSTRPKGWINA